MELDSDMGCACGGVDDDDDDLISPGQKREEKARADFLKNSVKEMNALYQSLGKYGREMQIRQEEQYWVMEAKPEKNKEKDE
jgi:hypothetical protein